MSFFSVNFFSPFRLCISHFAHSQSFSYFDISALFGPIWSSLSFIFGPFWVVSHCALFHFLYFLPVGLFSAPFIQLLLFACWPHCGPFGLFQFFGSLVLARFATLFISPAFLSVDTFFTHFLGQLQWSPFSVGLLWPVLVLSPCFAQFHHSVTFVCFLFIARVLQLWTFHWFCTTHLVMFGVDHSLCHSRLLAYFWPAWVLCLSFGTIISLLT